MWPRYNNVTAGQTDGWTTTDDSNTAQLLCFALRLSRDKNTRFFQRPKQLDLGQNIVLGNDQLFNQRRRLWAKIMHISPATAYLSCELSQSLWRHLKNWIVASHEHCAASWIFIHGHNDARFHRQPKQHLLQYIPVQLGVRPFWCLEYNSSCIVLHSP